MLSKGKHILLFGILILLVLFTRFYKLDWGNGLYFHPDENNMVNSILRMKLSDLNPHFYAYGQFPLYITFFTTLKHDFNTIVLTLRFWSATFSSISLIFFYFIGKKIFNSKKISFLFILLLIFTPGLIQLSHFGTTESILLFVFSANIFLSFKIFDSQKNKYILLASLVSGIGLATKLTSLILTTPVFLSLFLILIKKRNFIKVIFNSLLFLFFTVLVGFIFSPYDFLNFSQFLSTMKYEIGVATGQTPVFYTRQFINTIPYLFQLQKIFPYTNGLPVFILGIIGLFFILKPNTYLILTLFPSLIYFLYQGQLFTKWTRFMSPVFFIFPLLSIFILKTLKSKIIQYILILICILPGIYFMRIYFSPDIRLQASNWINQNISTTSQVLSESGNVINLPIDSNLNVTNFDFYTLDSDKKNEIKLTNLIKDSDYILIPSRRVFKNQNNPSFPYSQKYYQSLFNNKLGFNQIKQFSSNNSLFLNSENAEETWSVFDNPTIRIFKKND